MDRITVNNAIAEKLKRFPNPVILCNERGNSLWRIELADQAGVATSGTTLTESEIQQTLRDIFVHT